MAVIVYKQADGTEKTLDAGDRPLVIGRLEESDILVHDAFISRVQCGIAYYDHQFHLKDLGSSNGTYRNGTRVFECTLAPGDRIQIGNTTLLFEVDNGTVILRQITSPGKYRPSFAVTGPMPLPPEPGSAP
jgi:pSer/pThr/pTyr-binding forkhead associated (FHA) protein